jgi:hypothetical protein
MSRQEALNGSSSEVEKVPASLPVTDILRERQFEVGVFGFQMHSDWTASPTDEVYIGGGKVGRSDIEEWLGQPQPRLGLLRRRDPVESRGLLGLRKALREPDPRHIATLSGLKGSTWKIEVYGENNVDEVTQVAEEMRQRVGAEVEVELVDERERTGSLWH